MIKNKVDFFIKIILTFSLMYNLKFIYNYISLKKFQNQMVCKICESRLPFSLDLSKLNGIENILNERNYVFEDISVQKKNKTLIEHSFKYGHRIKNEDFFSVVIKGSENFDKLKKKIIFNASELKENNPCRYGKFGPRILCAVFTHKEAHDDIKYIQNTWGRR